MKTNQFRHISEKVVASLESKQTPFINYIITFFAIVILREYFECYSQSSNIFDSPYPLWTLTYQNALAYLVLLLPMGLIAHYASREPLENVYRVMIPCMILLMLTPLLDLMLTSGRGTNISYLLPYQNVDLLKNYLTFWGAYYGVSTGMRIEVGIMLTIYFVYLRQKKCSMMTSAIATLAAYTWIFIFGCTPIMLAAFFDFFEDGQHFLHPNMVMQAFLLFLFSISFWVGYLLNKDVFKALMKDIRVLRIAYYELALLFGVAIAFSVQNANIITTLKNNPHIMIDTVMLMISLFLACVFCLMINNIYDVKIDKISNPDRPLVAGTVSAPLYTTIAYFVMALALFYASVVESRAIMIIGLVMGSYYLYSATPLRIKRVPVLSKLVIALNTAALTLLGFITVQEKTFGFPVALLWINFIGVTLVANCIDLKDVAGDKAEGIVTMPIFMGEKLAKLVIGAAGFGLGVSYIFVLKDMMALPGLILFGLVFFWLVNLRRYQDKKILLLCNIGLLGMIFFLMTKAWLGIDLGIK